MRTSARLPGSLEPNALTLELSRLRSAGIELLDLTLSNPIAAGLGYPGEALLQALHAPQVQDYSPDARGHHFTREAIALWHGRGVDPD